MGTRLNIYLASDRLIHSYGRNCIDENGAVLFTWTGSGIEFLTDSSEAWVDIDVAYEGWEEWIRVEVDGFCLQRMMLPKGKNLICLFSKLNTENVCKVRILKENQTSAAETEHYLLLKKIMCDGGLYPVPEKKYRFEFVGDSLTAGEGLGGSKTQTGWSSAAFGLDGHYAITTAEHFQADYRLIALSGRGVYCGYNNSMEIVMPKYYEQTCGIVKSRLAIDLGGNNAYDFSKWVTDVVVINLGSNDCIALDRPAWTDPETGKEYKLGLHNIKLFQDAVIDFLKKVRFHNQDAFILWAYGMLNDTLWDYIEDAVAMYRIETGDTKAEFLRLPLVAEESMGSNNHPGKQCHQQAAKVICDKLEQVLET